jgi:ABC-type lipoprotein export system ATPase subunit
MSALKDVQRQMGTTVIVVTHNMEIAAQMDRLVTLVDGRITSDVEGEESVESAALKLFRQKRLTGELQAVKA